MKKSLVCIMICLILCFPILAEATDDTFISLNDFNIYFNFAAALTGSGNAIRENNISFSPGAVNDIYQVNLTSNVGMQISTPHIAEYNGTLSDVNGIILLYVPDGSTDSSMNFLYGIGEIAIATGAISSSSEIVTFLEQLGLMDDIGQTDASNAIEVNGLNYGYTISSVIGYFFYVEKAD